MIRLVMITIFWCLASTSQGAMVIDRAVITFSPDDSPREDLVVSNPDDEPLFIDIEVLTVSHPGTGVEERKVVKDPESIGLIATPRRMMVPPGGQRIVRLVNLNGHEDRERVYRVNLNPVSGPVESEQMGVRILVGYQLLVFAEPRERDVKLEGKRQGRELTLFNAGNVNIVAQNSEQCPPSPTPGECETVKGRRLYPGNTTVLDLPYDAPVTLSFASGDKSFRRTFE